MHYMALQPISFRWPQDLIDRVDAARGDVPRSRFIQRTVEMALDLPGTPVARGYVVEETLGGAGERTDEAPQAEYKSRPDSRPAPPRRALSKPSPRQPNDDAMKRMRKFYGEKP